MPGMNRQIVQLFGLTLLLFALLIAYTSRWTVFEADELNEMTDLNRRPLIEEQQVPRGLILADNGEVLARSVPRGRGEDKIYTRNYPTGSLFSQAVGYSFISRGRAGLERSRNDALTGEQNEFGTIFRELQARDSARATTSARRSTARARRRRSRAWPAVAAPSWRWSRRRAACG